MPEGIGHELHLHVHPGSASAHTPGARGVTHWTKPIVPAARSLVGTTADALLHIAQCLVLVGDRLVLQIDGYEFHSSSAQRSANIAHDAELRLRGYTVLRFSYAQVVHDWPTLERTVRRAVAAGLHLAA
ncbi:endonuclease domain-containing protein [Microbacterium kyungheense]|uniref:Very-short-patch-repair endonuclease n=2 Tax=Microbacterium kyungheense TaxID=1263636 RepID=A0A543FJU9_9MICO|nr:endonuclease domain-containing protein [Microbacterium kyungheense]TQM34153.1 hypothetical protein FB391_0440 [Microbacterium kyungheense]